MRVINEGTFANGQNLIILRNIEPESIIDTKLVSRQSFHFITRREDFFIANGEIKPDINLEYLAVLYQLTNTIRLLRTGKSVLVSAPFLNVTMDLLKYMTASRARVNSNISIHVLEGLNVEPLLPKTAKDHTVNTLIPWEIVQKHIKA